MDTNVSDSTASQPDTTKLNRFRERFAAWTTFSTLIVFLIVSIAIWGWAVWQAGAFLMSLLF